MKNKTYIYTLSNDKLYIFEIETLPHPNIHIIGRKFISPLKTNPKIFVDFLPLFILESKVMLGKLETEEIKNEIDKTCLGQECCRHNVYLCCLTGTAEESIQPMALLSLHADNRLFIISSFVNLGLLSGMRINSCGFSISACSHFALAKGFPYTPITFWRDYSCSPEVPLFPTSGVIIIK
jgi:hypothetical protein